MATNGTKLSGTGTSQRFSWLKSLLKDLSHTTLWLALLALAMLLGGNVWIWVYAFNTPGSHWSYVAVGMMTALAALLVGLFTGFLIGIPRVVSSGEFRLTADRFSPSSNLAEISDWLTKLLLGAGLVSLSRLGGPIGKLIDGVAGGLHGKTSDPAVIQAAKVTAGTIMIAFTVLGLLVGYIVTSTWYQARLEKLAKKSAVPAAQQNKSNGVDGAGGGTGDKPTPP